MVSVCVKKFWLAKCEIKDNNNFMNKCTLWKQSFILFIKSPVTDGLHSGAMKFVYCSKSGKPCNVPRLHAKMCVYKITLITIDYIWQLDLPII